MGRPRPERQRRRHWTEERRVTYLCVNWAEKGGGNDSGNEHERRDQQRGYSERTPRSQLCCILTTNHAPFLPQSKEGVELNGSAGHEHNHTDTNHSLNRANRTNQSAYTPVEHRAFTIGREGEREGY
jgi:hypothetical protein